MLLATCPDCQKRFRVPHDRKDWNCKTCDAVLEIVQDTPEASGASCPECEAPIEPSAHFCEECGASLGGGEKKAAKRKRVEEVDAGVKMRAARKMIDRLRTVLSIFLVLRVITFILAIGLVFVALSPLGSDMMLALISLGLVGLDLGLLIWVRYQLSRRPFMAALILASIATLSLILNLLTSEAEGVSLLIVLAFGSLFPAFYWSVVFKAATLTRLAEEYPDLYLSRRMRGEHDHRRGGGQGSVNQRSRARIKRDRRPPIVSLSVLGVILTGVIGYGLLNRPSSPEEVLETLVVAWDERDVAGLASFVDPKSREKWVRSLKRVPEIYDWEDDWPEVVEYSWEVDEDVVRVEFLTEAGTLPFKMRWTRESDWQMSSMSFREVKDWKR